MTANNTPRQGLISPVDSDLFLSSDFATTFGKLDAVPGVTIVANYAALTALNWGIPQHGSKVLQTDIGAEWFWYNPSGTGVWKRTNTIGQIVRVDQSSPVSTTVTSGNGAHTMETGNFTVPGGRALAVDVYMGCDNNSGVNGQVLINLFDNGTLMASTGFRPGTKGTVAGYACTFRYNLAAPANNSTHHFLTTILSSPQSSALGGGGTSVSRSGFLVVSEI